MPDFAFAERRSRPRFPSDGLLVCVRKKGRLGRLEGLAQNFNRHGLAMVVDQPLPKDSTVYLSLFTSDIKLDNVIGVVHNCTSTQAGYRCGIQFRIHSNLQMDQALIEHELTILEARFKTLGPAVTET
jgi:PilZ domain-containing protein